MAIGTRIVERLKEIKKDRRYLFETVYGLTPQALSNLIKRDSKRSEWDERIAEALGVSVMWLVYGHEQEKETASVQCAQQTAATYDFQSQMINDVIRLMAKLDPERQREVSTFAEERLLLQAASQNSTKRAG